MKRLLFGAVCLVAVVHAAAAKVSRRYDCPYAVVRGWYVVRLETPVGPRRFIFDTGCSVTALSEALCRELGLHREASLELSDFTGQTGTLARTRVDSLAIGPFVTRNVPVLVLPDSMLALRCAGVSGIAGADLLRGLTIRLPVADSTITVTDDCRLLGKLDRKRSVRLEAGSLVPMIPVRFTDGKRSLRGRALFDTGASGTFYYCTGSARDIFREGIARDVRRTRGVSSDTGWTGRPAQGEIAVGRIPSLELCGATLADVPFRTRAGNWHVIGADLLQMGQVVIDFRKRRFWFLPAPDAQLRYSRQSPGNVAPALVGGRLVVGQVWDETLDGVIAPGDRIVRLGPHPAQEIDPCTLLEWRDRPAWNEITVERGDGVRVRVPIETLNRK